MSEPLAVITGASGDLGAELCALIAQSGIDLVLVDRNAGKSDALAAALNARFENRVKGSFVVDLADHSDTRRLAAELLGRHPRIDYLFNNAGVLTESLQSSKYRNEMHFEVNTLAPLELIDLLRPALRRSGAGLVINTTAGLSLSVHDLDWDKLIAPAAFTKLFGPYAKSKQALNVLTVALGRELSAEKILLRAVDPGPNRTRLTKGAGTPLWMRIFAPFMPKPAKGAQKIFDAAFDPQWDGETGVVISGRKIQSLPPTLSDRAFQDKFLGMCRQRAAITELS